MIDIRKNPLKEKLLDNRKYTQCSKMTFSLKDKQNWQIATKRRDTYKLCQIERNRRDICWMSLLKGMYTDTCSLIVLKIGQNPHIPRKPISKDNQNEIQNLNTLVAMKEIESLFNIFIIKKSSNIGSFILKSPIK